MVIIFESYAIRAGSQCLRRCFSRNVGVRPTSTEEFILQPHDNFTSIRRENEKSLRIAILGAPNVGKSTLVNRLIKRSICATSSKVHTTKIKANAIYWEGNTQLVFTDTPGTVTVDEMKRFKLANSFRGDPKASTQMADIIGIVQDVHNIYTRHKLDPNILDLLKHVNSEIPLILLLNKVDKLKKKEILLHLVTVLTKSKNSPKFADIFMISALTEDGIDDLRAYLLDSAKPREWHYQKHIYSDHTCEDIIQETVRAKLLDNLPNEIPYNLQVKLEHFNPGPDDSIDALLSIICPNKRAYNTVLSCKGEKLKNVAIAAEKELAHGFRTAVKLKLAVQSMK